MSGQAVAFLRAINVGGRVVKMDRLRSVFEAIGLGGVETFIASGNVVFDPGRRKGRTLEAAIAARLEAALGYSVATFVRSTAEVGAIVRGMPFDATEVAAAHTILVGFLQAAVPPAAQRRAIETAATEADALRFEGRDVYWLTRVSQGESKFSLPKFERAIGGPATFRNINTVQRLALKYPAGSAC